MKNLSQAAPIPANVAEVMSVFAEQLGKVVFPDVSAELLGKLADQVHQQLEQVHKAEAALAAAQDKLQASQQDLTALAARALAYAKIYAEDKPALAERLEAINLRPPKPPRKAKPPKAAGPKPEKSEKPEKTGKPGRPRKDEQDKPEQPDAKAQSKEK